MRKLLFKNNGVNVQNITLASIEITVFSLLITWTLEFLANELLLRY